MASDELFHELTELTGLSSKQVIESLIELEQYGLVELKDGKLTLKEVI